jgi:glycosyltransferase involved in cell wall biosynthesis
MPAYNEEKYIGTMVLAAKQYADEVIVLDDGSTDEIPKLVAPILNGETGFVIDHRHFCASSTSSP